VIVPQAAPAQPNPLTLQVTAVLLDPVIVAVNCCFAAMFSSALLGEILTFTVTGAIIVTVVEPDIDGVESDVAVTTTALGLGAVFGAV